MKTRHDIIIVGGGMVGTALACALQPTELSIGLIEAQEPQANWPDDSFDLRVSAITTASERIFRSLDVWDTMTHMRVSPFREMFVWDATGSGEIHFDSADIGTAALGHIVENRVTQLALFQKAQSLPNLTLYCPSKSSDLRKLPQGYQLHLDSGQTLTCSLLVAADGAQSWIRDRAGIKLNTHDYQQTAVVATVKTELSHNETAWQIFLPTGPLAFLPLNNGYSSIVWSTSKEQAEKLLVAESNVFHTLLQKAFADKLGKITESGPRAAFPLKSRHAQQYVLPHLALIGDAAHTIHPLAGQGVNLGLADAATLAEVLCDSQDFSSFRTLRRYERWRKGENLTMLTAMTGFKYLFSNKHPLLRQSRNFGLTITDQITPLKNFFIRHAMGLSGDLPKIARGA